MCYLDVGCGVEGTKISSITETYLIFLPGVVVAVYLLIQ